MHFQYDYTITEDQNGNLLSANTSYMIYIYEQIKNSSKEPVFTVTTGMVNDFFK